MTTRYKVWAWGTPVGQGYTGAHYVGIAGIAKAASPTDPLIIVNELVCNAFAQALLLPCPPGATLDNNGVPYFFSLNFNLAGQQLPPADANLVATSFPRLSWGVILFDSLVMNFDRHERNIAHDITTNKVQIFDHSHAFLHAGNPDVDAVLAHHDGRLCIGDHCLSAEIATEDGLDYWANRIEAIPDFYIEDVLTSVVDAGLPLAKRDDCIDFMKKRRLEISNIAKNNRNEFPNLPQVLP